ncbi:aminotransferase class I/II-fold pyridoxal phosphate-dependent enzyme [Bacteroides coprosuis]|uniref:aminotransferase class I/II-fold pyridoxal phosphate-dependent enzyme n=1 Tax=Bacteroides coprosuis TaxID=151276 RepID=UPI001D257534|nr:8-amino-7-oxononanoate synthase [Bacteroides coprosuis]HJD91869.1 8-amino-7-oxononanoate synthase [Bacteroides coprosuis]
MREELQELKKNGLARNLTPSCYCANEILIGGKSYINLSSNDYLGISSRLDWQKEFLDGLAREEFLMGATSSRLLTGNSWCKEELETFIGIQYGKECLVYNSGYHANLGVLPALTNKEDLVLADKLVHASIIDGLRLCGCKWMRYRHNDSNHLERLLKEYHSLYENIYVVTESLFSMDGDFVDLERLLLLKNKYSFKLYLDEAHAIGVVGNHGLGLAEEKGALSEVDYLVGTLSKALASEGGFIITDLETKEWLINKSRSFIFTTAGAPVSSLWSQFVFKKMLKMKEERLYLRKITEDFRSWLPNKNVVGESQIIPLIMRNNNECLSYSDKLRHAGLWVSPIRYPSVPLRQPRIRFSLTAALKPHQMQKIHEALLD